MGEGHGRPIDEKPGYYDVVQQLERALEEIRTTVERDREQLSYYRDVAWGAQQALDELLEAVTDCGGMDKIHTDECQLQKGTGLCVCCAPNFRSAMEWSRSVCFSKYADEPEERDE
jgi:hypothetical protein